MMLVIRLVFGLLLLSGILCFAAFVATGNAVWRQRGLVVVKWALVMALGFAAVVVLERMALWL